MRLFLFYEARAADYKRPAAALAKKVGNQAHNDRYMVIFSAVKLKELFEKERDYLVSPG